MNQYKIFKVLLEREILVLRTQLRTTFFDAGIVSLMHVLALRFFLPSMGMDPRLRVPLYLGYIIAICFFVGFVRGIGVTTDISRTKSINFHFALPISPRLVFLSYVLGNVITYCLTAIPILLFGVFALSGTAHFGYGLIKAVAFFVLNTFFFSMLFFSLSVYFRPDRYFDIMWPRILGPMFTLGGIFFTYAKVASLSPLISKLFLMSPALYCSEGLRGSLFPEMLHSSFSVGLCALIVSLCTAACYALGMYAVSKRLDPVVQRNAQ